jgi:DNA-binding CsgD family transcriptional regulator
MSVGTLARLSPRQREIVGLITEGLAYKEVAYALSISPHTVKNTLTAIYEQLGISCRTALLKEIHDDRLVTAQALMLRVAEVYLVEREMDYLFPGLVDAIVAAMDSPDGTAGPDRMALPPAISGY